MFLMEINAIFKISTIDLVAGPLLWKEFKLFEC